MQIIDMDVKYIYSFVMCNILYVVGI